MKNRNETKATALLSLSSPCASGMRRFFQVTCGLLGPPRSVSRLSYPEADEQRAWAWVGRAEASQRRQERNSRDEGASSSNTELCSCRRPCLPPPPAPSPVVLSARAPPPPWVKWGPNSPITCSPQPRLQRSLQGTRPGPNCRLCPGLVGGGGPRHQGDQGGPGPPFALSHLCPCFGLCLMQTLNLSHLGNLLLKMYLRERGRRRESDPSTEKGRWAGREHGACRREPDPTRSPGMACAHRGST